MVVLFCRKRNTFAQFVHSTKFSLFSVVVGWELHREKIRVHKRHVVKKVKVHTTCKKLVLCFCPRDLFSSKAARK